MKKKNKERSLEERIQILEKSILKHGDAHRSKIEELDKLMKETQMKAIKIDAVNRKIEEIDIDGLPDMQAAVGGLIEIGHHFRPSADIIYVDEEGLLKEPDNFFAIEHETQLLAGNGLIVGTGHQGEEKEPEITIEYVQKHVLWMDAMTVALYMAMTNIGNS